MALTSLEGTELVVRTIADTAIENEKYFAELDGVCGDGDFGISLASGFSKVVDPEKYARLYCFGTAANGLLSLHVFAEAEHLIMKGKLMDGSERMTTVLTNAAPERNDLAAVSRKAGSDEVTTEVTPMTWPVLSPPPARTVVQALG